MCSGMLRWKPRTRKEARPGKAAGEQLPGRLKDALGERHRQDWASVPGSENQVKTLKEAWELGGREKVFEGSTWIHIYTPKPMLGSYFIL